EIADVAGVNQALLHYYFRSKDRLAAAVFRQAARQLMPRVIAVLGSDASIEEKVEQVVHLEIEQLARAPYLPGYILSELSHDPDRVHQLIAAMMGVQPDGFVPHVFATLKRQLSERARAGTMRRIAPEQFVINLLALCIFPFAAKPMLMAILQLDQSGFDRLMTRRRREITTFVLNALRP
ncbi:MAG TPA: TetR/AcrR family transcriptional regulator, partial [Gemmatimonadaceae bacterium]|nr:TetR/AcrR family transcriptional regulator [Gemmatimonadaceae bacterium]